ncbi:MAG: hypothetical protein NO516_05410 [Candidatus Methanomethylicia archaeon]|nr:hypothetical protein [Candidatus Methanomethylicia archaeon]
MTRAIKRPGQQHRRQYPALEASHRCVIPRCGKEVPPDGPTCCMEHDPKAWEVYEWHKMAS